LSPLGFCYLTVCEEKGMIAAMQTDDFRAAVKKFTSRAK